jgi:hypothetical protein
LGLNFFRGYNAWANALGDVKALAKVRARSKVEVTAID